MSSIEPGAESDPRLGWSALESKAARAGGDAGDAAASAAGGCSSPVDRTGTQLSPRLDPVLEDSKPASGPEAPASAAREAPLPLIHDADSREPPPLEEHRTPASPRSSGRAASLKFNVTSHVDTASDRERKKSRDLDAATQPETPALPEGSLHQDIKSEDEHKTATEFGQLSDSPRNPQSPAHTDLKQQADNNISSSPSSKSPHNTHITAQTLPEPASSRPCTSSSNFYDEMKSPPAFCLSLPPLKESGLQYLNKKREEKIKSSAPTTSGAISNIFIAGSDADVRGPTRSAESKSLHLDPNATQQNQFTRRSSLPGLSFQNLFQPNYDTISNVNDLRNFNSRGSLLSTYGDLNSQSNLNAHNVNLSNKYFKPEAITTSFLNSPQNLRNGTSTSGTNNTNIAATTLPPPISSSGGLLSLGNLRSGEDIFATSPPSTAGNIPTMFSDGNTNLVANNLVRRDLTALMNTQPGSRPTTTGTSLMNSDDRFIGGSSYTNTSLDRQGDRDHTLDNIHRDNKTTESKNFPPPPPKYVNSKLDELRTRILVNPQTVNTNSHLMGYNKRLNNTDDSTNHHDDMDTAAEVLSNMRSSPYRVKRLNSAGGPLTSADTGHIGVAGGQGNRNYYLSPSSATASSSGYSHNGPYFTGNTIPIGTTSRPHSASFSTKGFPRPILRINQKEKAYGDGSSALIMGDEEDEDMDYTSDIDTISTLNNNTTRPFDIESKLKMNQKDRIREVTWNKNGKRITRRLSAPESKRFKKSNFVQNNSIPQSANISTSQGPQHSNNFRNVFKIETENGSAIKNRNYEEGVRPEKITMKSQRHLNSNMHISAPTRSRTGCWICRLRKKKCTEEKPACYNCQRLKLDCYYHVIKPDFVANPMKRKEKLDEIKLKTKEAKRRAMKRKASTGSAVI